MSAIFISHSSRNRDLAIQVLEQLSAGSYSSVFLDVDRDDGIIAGEKWESVLYRELRACQVVVALVSDDWLASRWCFAELSHAREKGKIVIGLQIAANVDKSILGDTQLIAFTPDMQTQGYERLARGLSNALDIRGVHKWDPSRSPYPGLLTFEEDDAAVFFGRDATVRELKEKLVAIKRNPGPGKRFMMVLGASGSGKSSLVRAGVVPLLKNDQDRNNWLALAPFRPGARPLNELAKAYSGAFRDYGDNREWSSIRDIFTGVLASSPSNGERLRDITEDLRMRARRPQATLLITIDQVEELLGPDDGRFLEQFFALLGMIVKSHGHEVLLLGTLRSDFLAELQNNVAAGQIPYEAYHLESAAVDYRAVIEGPARIAAIELEAGLVGAMVADTGNKDALALLAFTLGELWKRYGTDRRLTVEEYRNGLGGLHGSVARAAEQLYAAAALSVEQQAEVRRTFLRMARVDEAGRFVKRSVRWSDQPAIVRDILERFIQARLLISRSEDGERVIEVAHDILFGSWDTLAEWLRSDKPFLLWRGRVQAAVGEWMRTGQDRATLLRGNPLNEAESWFANRGAELSENETAFIRASIEQRAIERAEAEVREWKARLEAARGFYERSFVFSEQARFQPAAACLLRALELAPRNGAPENFPAAWGSPAWARAAWTQYKHLGAVRAYRCARLSQHTGPVTSVAFATDGRRLVTGCADGKARLFDVETGALLQVLGASGPISVVAVTSDGGKLVSGNAGGTLNGWHLETGKGWMEGRVLQSAAISSAAFSSDANRVAFGATDGMVGWLDLSSRAYGIRAIHGGAVTAIAFSPDGQSILSGSSWNSAGDCTGDGSGSVWDLTTDKSAAMLFARLETITAIAFNPAGDTAIRGFESGATQLCGVGKKRDREEALEGHGGSVTCVAFSADGKIAASGSADNTVKLWDVETRELLLVLEAHVESVMSVAFSPDGGRLASASSDRSCVVWDIRNIYQPRSIPGVGSAAGIAVNANGSKVVTASGMTPQIWDVNTGAPAQRFEGHTGNVRAVEFYPDGNAVISGAEDAMIRVWDAQTGSSLHTLGGHAQGVSCLALSGDGETLLSGDSGRKLLDGAFARESALAQEGAGVGFIALSNAQTGSTALLNWHAMSISCVAVSPDGGTLASGSWDGTVRVSDMRTGKQLQLLRGHSNAVFSVAFTPDGTRILSGSVDRTVRVWDIETARQMLVFSQHTGGVGSIAVSRDGARVFTASADSTVSIWLLATGEELRMLSGHTDAVTSVALSPDGRLALTGSLDRALMLWDVETGEMLKQLHGHDDAVWSVAFSPDGKNALSGSDDATLRVWNLQTGIPSQILKGHTDGLGSVAYSPDGRTVMSASKDGTIRLWDLAKSVVLRVLEGHRGAVLGAAFSPNGKQIVSGADDLFVRIWDVETGSTQRVISGEMPNVHAVAIGAGGKIGLAGLGDGVIRMWNVQTGADLGRLEGHSAPVTCLAASADGRFALSGSDDKAIRVWDLATNRPLRILKGHAARVAGVKFSLDAETAVSASVDGTVRLWDIETGKQLRCLKQPIKRGATLALYAAGGSQLEISIPSLGMTDVAAAASGSLILASDWDGQAVLVWTVVDSRTPAAPPAVLEKDVGNPYREFDSLYASVGWRVVREGPDQGEIELVE